MRRFEFGRKGSHPTDRLISISLSGIRLTCELLSAVFRKPAHVIEATGAYAVQQAILAVPESKLSKKWRHRANTIQYNAQFVSNDFKELFAEHKGIIQALERPERRIEYAMRLFELWLMG